jgi:hypothetical protein
MYTASMLHHRVAGCPCGHREHAGERQHLAEGKKVDVIRCAECERLADAEAVVLAVVALETFEMEGLQQGAIIRWGGLPHRIVAAVPITKLGGAYFTGNVMMKLRKAAMKEAGE